MFNDFFGKRGTRYDKSTAPDRVERACAFLAILLLAAATIAVFKGRGQWAMLPWQLWIHLGTLAVALAITPDYLVQTGLLPKNRVPSADKDIGLLLRQAMDKVAFLPFGLMVDRWRWGVYSGEIAPGAYQKGWDDLRLRYQGVKPPVARDESKFDPGAKYHIPGNVPYTRYFLAHILQFQMQRALCEAAGHKGPLAQCSIYGNNKAGLSAICIFCDWGLGWPWICCR